IISNISHELRTPITIMRGFIEVAMGETDPEKRNKHLERAISAVDRQNIMIQDLIETAMGKIKNLDLVFENVDFKDILETSLKDVEPKAKLSDINIKIDLEKNLYVKADQQQLTYVLTKLMDNAIKFTENGGKLEVLAKQKDGFVEVCVKDTGIGISKENLNKIFDKFFQVDATTTRKYSGSGVGLTISKNIIEKHGGNIWVESELGKGTTFFFTIPKASSKQMSFDEYN
ncbi:MAG: GHKL domain-containing protein, partial [Methanosarcinaceae archaeon]|nr:GHKL domain-containing protein [Methanosarcinaceae archaeon]